MERNADKFDERVCRAYEIVVTRLPNPHALSPFYCAMNLAHKLEPARFEMVFLFNAHRVVSQARFTVNSYKKCFVTKALKNELRSTQPRRHSKSNMSLNLSFMRPTATRIERSTRLSSSSYRYAIGAIAHDKVFEV